MHPAPDVRSPPYKQGTCFTGVQTRVSVRTRTVRRNRSPQLAYDRLLRAQLGRGPGAAKSPYPRGLPQVTYQAPVLTWCPDSPALELVEGVGRGVLPPWTAGRRPGRRIPHRQRAPGRRSPHREEGDWGLHHQTAGASHKREPCSTWRLYDCPPTTKGGQEDDCPPTRKGGQED